MSPAMCQIGEPDDDPVEFYASPTRQERRALERARRKA